MINKIFKTVGLITTFICSLNTFAGQIEYAGLYYQTIDNSNNVIVIAGTDKYLLPQYVIPESFTYQDVTYTVTGIGKKAFYGCSNLLNIELPNSLQKIEEWAFYNSGLSKITMPNVVSIDEYAFGLCSNLNTIELPSSLLTIGQSVFSSSGLREIVIPASVTSIGKNAFASCDKLNTIEVEANNAVYYTPDGCNAIITINDNKLIAGCSGTQNIPNNIRAIGDNAFYGSKLTSISLPQSVTTIGDYAFFGCSSLLSVDMSDKVESIGESAFGLCSKLKDIQLSSVLLSIGRSAFSSSGLTSIVIPKSVILVGKSAFSNCDNLKTMQIEAGNTYYASPNNCNAIIQGDVLVAGCTGTKIIPDNVTIIGENAFYGSGITDIELPSAVTTIEERAFYGCRSLASVNLSNVKYLDEYAFCFCSSLSSIAIPASTKSIGRSAFSHCSKLNTVVSYLQNPFVISDDVFDGLYDAATLYVPNGTAEKYKSTAGWNQFNIIVESIPSSIPESTIALIRIYSDNGIIYIDSSLEGYCMIYSLSGQISSRVFLKSGKNVVEGLGKGLYLINGKKVIVK